MSLSLIAAVADNNCIGLNNKLPWHLPEDMEHFKKITTGKIVLMGRKTWESLPEKFRPLPKRLNIVVTRQKNFVVPAGVEIFDSIASSIERHAGQEIVVIGGAQLYAETLPLADTLYITEVHKTVAGDAFFPVIDRAVWKEAVREDHSGFSFVTYKKQLSS